MFSVHVRLAMLCMEIHVQQVRKWGKSKSSTLPTPQHGDGPFWEIQGLLEIKDTRRPRALR